MKLALELLCATDGSLAPNPQPVELSTWTDDPIADGNRGATAGDCAAVVGPGMASGFRRLPEAGAEGADGAARRVGSDGGAGLRVPWAGSLFAAGGVAAGLPAAAAIRPSCAALMVVGAVP